MTARPIDPGLQTYVDEREKLIAIACRVVESRAVAEEIVQESWFRWQDKKYPSKMAKPLFRSIVMNLARDWKRRQRLERAILEALPERHQDTRDAERVVIARQELRRMVSALEELEPHIVTAFQLHRIEGLTMVQIAERQGTVPSRVHACILKALTHVTFRLME